VFDTETTGLIAKNALLYEYPYITQFSMIIYDMTTGKICRTFNTYVKIPDHVKIPEIVTQITGITREMCDGGISVVDVLTQFYRECSIVNCVVAHNITFDLGVLLGEFYRHRNTPDILVWAPHWMRLPVFASRRELTCKIYGIPSVGAKVAEGEPAPPTQNTEIYCTMQNSIMLCNISVSNAWGKIYLKFPKLSETFCHLFPNEKVPDNLHDAIIDTLVCLRCFVMIKWGEDIAQNTKSNYRDYYVL
jgi:DNA polymerase III epsilon subunit-like protein